MDVGPISCLVTAGHVWDEVVARTLDHVVLRGPVRDVQVELDSLTIHEIHTDVYLVVMPPNVFAQLGVAKPRIGAFDRATAKIAGPESMGTVGVISIPRSAAFGTVWYEGTTLPGYSGCPYSVNGMIVGMHLRGAETRNGANIGVSAQMLYVTAKYVLNQKLEDTEEWIAEVLSKKDEVILVDKNWGHSDSSRIFLRNSYHILENDVLYGAVGDRYQKNLQFVDLPEDLEMPKKKRGKRGENLESSGNGKTPGASELSDAPGVFRELKRLASQKDATTRYAGLWKRLGWGGWKIETIMNALAEAEEICEKCQE